MSQPIPPLPAPLASFSTLARWIWTLYRDHPNLTNAALVAVTGAQKSNVSQATSQLLSGGLLTRTDAGVQAVTTFTDWAMSDSHHDKLQTRTYQTLRLAERQARTLFTTGGAPHHVYQVRLPKHLNVREHLDHAAQGTVYVAAANVTDARAAVQRERDPNLFQWDGPTEDHPTITHVIDMTNTGEQTVLSTTRRNSEQHCFQSAKHAAAKAMALTSTTAILHHVFHVRLPDHLNTREHIRHPAQGGVYVAAKNEADVKRFVQQERDSKLFNWDEIEKNHPSITRIS